MRLSAYDHLRHALVSAVAIPSEVVYFLPCFFCGGGSCCRFLAVDFRDPLDFPLDFGGSLRGVLPPRPRMTALSAVYLVYIDPRSAKEMKDCDWLKSGEGLCIASRPPRGSSLPGAPLNSRPDI
jgi:hypothetical protein